MKEPGREHLHRRHGEEVFRAGGLRSQLMPPLSHMTFSRSLLLDSAFLKKNPENVPHLPRGPVRKLRYAMSGGLASEARWSHTSHWTPRSAPRLEWLGSLQIRFKETICLSLWPIPLFTTTPQLTRLHCAVFFPHRPGYKCHEARAFVCFIHCLVARTWNWPGTQRNTYTLTEEWA